jgi:hypothetical protein
MPSGLIEGGGTIRYGQTTHVAVVYVPFLQEAFSTVSLVPATGCCASPSQAACCGCAN